LRMHQQPPPYLSTTFRYVLRQSYPYLFGDAELAEVPQKQQGLLGWALIPLHSQHV
jgi:hypothetical protein